MWRDFRRKYQSCQDPCTGLLRNAPDSHLATQESFLYSIVSAPVELIEPRLVGHCARGQHSSVGRVAVPDPGSHTHPELLAGLAAPRRQSPGRASRGRGECWKFKGCLKDI